MGKIIFTLRTFSLKKRVLYNIIEEEKVTYSKIKATSKIP